MAHEFKALFAIKSQTSDAQNVIESYVFPSLFHLSADILVRRIVQAVLERGRGPCPCREPCPWKSPRWTEARQWLQTNVSHHVLQQVYAEFIEQAGDQSRYRCPPCVITKNVYHPSVIPKSDKSKFLLRWLFHDDLDKGFFSENLNAIEIKYLTEVETGLSFLIIFQKSWPKLKGAIERQKKLRRVRLHCGPRDCLKHLSAHCKLTALEVYLDLKLGEIKFCDEFFEFLESQSDTLTSLDFYCYLDSTSRERLWNILSSKCPNLKSLELFASDLIKIQNCWKTPLTNLTHLTIRCDPMSQDLSMVEVNAWWFPSLVDFGAYIYDYPLSPAPPTEIMMKLTTVKFRKNVSLPNHNYFMRGDPVAHFNALVKNCPSATSIDMMFRLCQLSCVHDPNIQMVNVRHLQFNVDSCSSIDGDVALQAFRYFPNLESLSLGLFKYFHFNEYELVQHLEKNPSTLPKLKSLNLKTDKVLSGRLALALLKNTGLQEIEDMTVFKLTSDDILELEIVAKEKNLRLIPAFKTSKKPGHDSCWFTCIKGQHILHPKSKRFFLVE